MFLGCQKQKLIMHKDAIWGVITEQWHIAHVIASRTASA